MAEQLPSVPEESATGFTDATPSPNCYRESIRCVGVVWPEWCVISTPSSQSGYSGSNYSSNSSCASSSYLSSNYSGCSSRSAFSAAADLGASELTRIAKRMINDGYTQRVFQAFIDMSSSPGVGYRGGCSLKNWFAELDVDWVLQIRNKYDLRQQLQLQEASDSWLQELVERWIRALTLIAVSIRELVHTVSDKAGFEQFGSTSISVMLVFVDAILQDYKTEKLQAMLHMYVCICTASYDMLAWDTFCSHATLNKIGGTLESEGNRLIESIVDRMVQVRRTLMNDVNSWATEIPRGRGEVHKNTLLVVAYVTLMRKAHASAQRSSADRHNTRKLGDLIHYTIDYLNNLLLRKSELCSDPSLRYLFLLNNSYFIAQMVSKTLVTLNLEPWGLWPGHQRGPKLTPECEKYLDSYLDVSWGHILSCISQSKTPGLLHRWVNSSSRNSLAEFKSAFHKTYQAQKFWKVPDPQLRDALRKSIAKRVISAYRNYLKEHPELEKYIGDEASNPEVLEEMLGELFEG